MRVSPRCLLFVNPIVDDNNNSNVDDELEEIKFQKLNNEAMRANEKILTLEDIIASPEHQLTIIYGDDSILNISKVGDIMNDMRPITTDKKTISSRNIVIPPVNPKLKSINNSPNGFVSVDVYDHCRQYKQHGCCPDASFHTEVDIIEQSVTG